MAKFKNARWFVFLKVSWFGSSQYHYIGRVPEKDTGLLQKYCVEFVFVNPLCIEDFISDNECYCGGDLIA